MIFSRILCNGVPGAIADRLFLMEIFIPILIIVGLPALIVIIMYNGFIGRRNAMRHAFSSIDVQLKKRWDLIPNLVETEICFPRKGNDGSGGAGAQCPGGFQGAFR